VDPGDAPLVLPPNCVDRTAEQSGTIIGIVGMTTAGEDSEGSTGSGVTDAASVALGAGAAGGVLGPHQWGCQRLLRYTVTAMASKANKLLHCSE
jgi:hypothetical protein